MCSPAIGWSSLLFPDYRFLLSVEVVGASGELCGGPGSDLLPAAPGVAVLVDGTVPDFGFEWFWPSGRKESVR